MSPDTPLEEVARHLPPEAAEHLDGLHSEVQIQTLTLLRVVVSYWDANNYTFDPIAYEGMVNALVGSIAPLFDALRDLNEANSALAQRLASADLLIASMARTLEMLAEPLTHTHTRTWPCSESCPAWGIPAPYPEERET